MKQKFARIGKKTVLEESEIGSIVKIGFSGLLAAPADQGAAQNRHLAARDSAGKR